MHIKSFKKLIEIVKSYSSFVHWGCSKKRYICTKYKDRNETKRRHMDAGTCNTEFDVVFPFLRVFIAGVINGPG